MLLGGRGQRLENRSKNTEGVFMGLLVDMFERRSGLATPEQWLVDWANGGMETNAGVSVNEESANTFSVFFVCNRILAETIGSLPLHLYRRLPGGGKERAVDHPLYHMMHSSPNPTTTSMTYRETIQGHIATWGNGFSFIEYERSGRVKGLWPLRPDKMTVKRENERLSYVYNTGTGGERVLDPFEVLHIPGFGFDGLTGYSIVSLARQGIGLGLAMEEFGARFFGSGAHPGSVAEHPGKLSPDAHTNLSNSLSKKISGLGKSHKLLLLEEGMTLHNVGIPPEDAQFLQSRQFQGTDVGRWFRMPPHMYGDLERANVRNIEQQSLEFMMYTMFPWFTLWEQWLNFKLLTTEADRRVYFWEFLVDALLKGDIKTRYDAYKIAKDSGWMNGDEIRERENMNPMPDGLGKLYTIPLNMTILGEGGSQDEDEDENSRKLAGVLMRNCEEGTKAQRHKGTKGKKEVRNNDGVRGRNRVVEVYRGLFLDAGGRIVRREGVAVKRAVRKFLVNGSLSEFNIWMERFYVEQFPENIMRDMIPVVSSFGESIIGEAGKEVGVEVEADAVFDDFARGYVDVFSKNYRGSSQGQIRQIMAENSVEDAAELIVDRVDDWEVKRADSVAMREPVEGNGAFTKFVYAAAGILTYRWVTQGANCRFCDAMNGRVIGIRGTFFKAGDSFDPAGAGAPMKIDSVKTHPPLHRGCDCSIAAG